MIDPSTAIFVMTGLQTIPTSLEPRRCIFIGDEFLIGPCAIEPLAHLRQRRAFWRHFNQTLAYSRRADDVWTKFWKREQATLVSFVRNPNDRRFQHPLVLWTARNWRDRLSFWWILHVLKERRVDSSRVWIAESVSGRRRSTEADWHLATHPLSRLEEAYQRGVRLTPVMLRAGSALWKRFAAPSPVSFDQARRRGVKCFPDLSAIAEVYGCLFPRLIGQRRPRLALSFLDHLLLSTLRRDEWLRPVDLLQNRRLCELIFETFGELFIAHRLRVWADRGRERAAVRVRLEARGVNALTKVAYQLTETGAHLIETGLHQFRDVPPMYVGGCKLYDSKRPWVRVNEGSGWRILKLHWTG